MQSGGSAFGKNTKKQHLCKDCSESQAFKPSAEFSRLWAGK